MSERTYDKTVLLAVIAAISGAIMFDHSQAAIKWLAVLLAIAGGVAAALAYFVFHRRGAPDACIPAASQEIGGGLAHAETGNVDRERAVSLLGALSDVERAAIREAFMDWQQKEFERQVQATVLKLFQEPASPLSEQMKLLAYRHRARSKGRVQTLRTLIDIQVQNDVDQIQAGMGNNQSVVH